MAVCCVVGCGRKYKRNDKDNNPKFYSIPIVNPYDPLTQLRRIEWLKRLNLSESSVTPKTKVCCAHFESGSPSYHLMKKDVDWAPIKNLEPQSKGEEVAQRAKRFIKISNLPKPEKRKRETSILKDLSNTPATSLAVPVDTRLEVLADDAQVVETPAHSEGTDGQEVNLSEACNVSMLKQEVASLSARVALLESQKRDLELANQDLSERLSDLERTSGRTDMCHRELQKDFLEMRDKLFKAYDDKNNSFVKSVLASGFKMMFYTRFSKLSFEALYQVLLPIDRHNSEKLCMRKQLLLTLIKLVHDFPHQDLAFRFGISPATSSLIFRSWVSIINDRLYKRIVRSPNRDCNKATLPMLYREHFSDLTEIIDCYETQVQKSHSLKDQVALYSSYKGRDTVKGLVAATGHGVLTFISPLFCGRKSDKHIVLQSGYLDHIQRGDLVLADRGFLIEEEMAIRGAKLVTPAFMKNQKQFDAKTTEATRRTANSRIHIERFIGSLRNRFKVMKGPIPIKYLYCYDDSGLTLYDKIVRVCGILNNLSPSIVSSD